MIINKVSDLNQRVGYLIQAREFLIRFNLIHRGEFLFNPVSNFFKKAFLIQTREFLIQTREYLIQTRVMSSRKYLIQTRVSDSN